MLSCRGASCTLSLQRSTPRSQLRLPRYKLSKIFDDRSAHACSIGLHVPPKREARKCGRALAPDKTDKTDKQLDEWLDRVAYDARSSNRQATTYSVRLQSGAFQSGKKRRVKPMVKAIVRSFSKLWRSPRLRVIASHGLGVAALQCIGADEELHELSGILDGSTRMPTMTCYTMWMSNGPRGMGQLLFSHPLTPSTSASASSPLTVRARSDSLSVGCTASTSQGGADCR